MEGNLCLRKLSESGLFFALPMAFILRAHKKEETIQRGCWYTGISSTEKAGVILPGSAASLLNGLLLLAKPDGS